jgi:hypothetical protein
MPIVSVPTKHDLLVDFIEGIFSDHSYTFQVYRDPVNQLLRASSRLQTRINSETADRVQFCSIYWAGPDEEAQFAAGDNASLLRLDGSQRGGVDLFRITLNLEWGSGEVEPGATSFQEWKTLIYGANPKGIIPQIRETPALNVTTGPLAGDIVALSLPFDTQFPSVPKPLQSLGIERAHYGEFVVAITDY